MRNTVFFWAKKLMERWYIIFTDYWKVPVLNFSVMGNAIFSWAKNFIKRWYYWLLRSSRFEVFGDGKHGVFSGKKLMERWYLPGLFELSMIFQDLGNMIFRAVKYIYIYIYIYIYFVCLSKNVLHLHKTKRRS